MVKNGRVLVENNLVILSFLASDDWGWNFNIIKNYGNNGRNKKTLAQLTEQVEIYPQLLINVRVTDKTLAQNDPDVQKAIEEVKED